LPPLLSNLLRRPLECCGLTIPKLIPITKYLGKLSFLELRAFENLGPLALTEPHDSVQQASKLTLTPFLSLDCFMLA